MPEGAGPESAHARGGYTWAFAFALGVLLAGIFMWISSKVFTGQARSNLGPAMLVLTVAAVAMWGLMRLEDQRSLKRYLAHLGLAALGFGLFFLVIFIMITAYTPSCPDPEPARALADLLDPSIGPTSCPG